MAFGDLVVKTIPGGKYKLTNPLIWKYAPNATMVVPAGFETDFASVPRFARWLIDGHSHTRKPAVLHDYLYNQAAGKRKDADLVFRKAMRDTDTPAWKRELAYRAVRIGGWVSWARYRQARQDRLESDQ